MQKKKWYSVSSRGLPCLTTNCLVIVGITLHMEVFLEEQNTGKVKAIECYRVDEMQQKIELQQVQPIRPHQTQEGEANAGHSASDFVSAMPGKTSSLSGNPVSR